MAEIDFDLLAGIAEQSGVPEDRSPSPLRSPQQLEAEQQEAQQPADPLDYYTASGPRLSPELRDVYEPHRQRWWAAFGDQFHERPFRDLVDYTDFVDNLRDESGRQLSIDEIAPFYKKMAVERMSPAIKREYQERVEARQADARFDQNMDRNLRMQKKIDEQYGEGRYIYNAKTGGIDKDDTAVKMEQQRIKEEDRLQKRIGTLQANLKALATAPGEAPLTGVLSTLKAKLEQELRDLMQGGENQDNEAVQWALANPNDPRAARILELNAGR